MPKINKTTYNKYWRGYGERKPSFTVGGVANSHSSLETTVEKPQMLKLNILHGPAIPLPD